MKKTILSLALVASALFASAQATLTLYKGDNTTDFLNGAPYSFDGAPVVVDSLKDGASDNFLYYSGSTTGYYIGGYGTSGYSTGGDKITISSVFNGDFATTTLGFSAFTDGTTPQLKIQLKSATATWGYIFDLSSASSSVAPFSAPLSSFKAIVNDQPTGDAFTATDFATIDEVQFVVGLGVKIGKGTVELDNLVLVDPNATGVEDNFLAANNNEVVSVYDMMGKFVATGKLKELGLESGKLYVVKSGNKSRKIVMN
jgi:hypothetical protein